MEKPNAKYVNQDLGSSGMTPVCEFDKQHGHYSGNVEGEGLHAVKPNGESKTHPDGVPFTKKGA